jgi:hypothetical protein
MKVVMLSFLVFLSSYVYAGSCDIKLKVINKSSTKPLGIEKIRTKPTKKVRRYKKVKNFSKVTIPPGASKVLNFTSKYGCKKSNGQSAEITYALYRSTLAPYAVRNLKWDEKDLINGKTFEVKLEP